MVRKTPRALDWLIYLSLLWATYDICVAARGEGQEAHPAAGARILCIGDSFNGHGYQFGGGLSHQVKPALRLFDLNIRRVMAPVAGRVGPSPAQRIVREALKASSSIFSR